MTSEWKEAYSDHPAFSLLCCDTVRVHLHLPSKQRLPMFQWQHLNKQHLNENQDQEEETLLVVINIFICAILCRQESRETLPLQLPLYSPALSLTL